MRIVVFAFESVFSNAIVRRLLDSCGSEVAGSARSDTLVGDKSFASSMGFLLRRSG